MPLAAFNDDEGSYFKEYINDTGLMFYKFGIEPELFLDPTLRSLLSEQNFSLSPHNAHEPDLGCDVKHLPLYAAYCIMA